jgi:hypothetical protein
LHFLDFKLAKQHESIKEHLLWSVSHSPLPSDLLGPDDIQQLGHTGIGITQTCVTGQMAKNTMEIEIHQTYNSFMKPQHAYQ